MAIKQRLLYIDTIRALSILGVMVIHSLALFLGPTLNNVIWNSLEFVVIAFVACSGYVTWLSFEFGKKQKHLLSWYGQRIVRLYVPFIVYVAVYAGLAYVLPGFVSGRGITFSQKFFLSSALLSGGADVGWLTLLFLQLSLITPVLIWIMRDTRRYYAVQSFLGLFVLTIVFLPISTTYSRMISWFPWSFIYLLGMRVAMMEEAHTLKSKAVFITSIVSAGIWIVLRYMLTAKGMLLTFTLHKYPPDMFYFAYSVAVSGVLLLVARVLDKSLHTIMPLITYISQKSYGMFFIQLITLDFLTTTFRHISLLPTMITSITLTVVVTWVWEKVRTIRS